MRVVDVLRGFLYHALLRSGTVALDLGWGVASLFRGRRASVPVAVVNGADPTWQQTFAIEHGARRGDVQALALEDPAALEAWAREQAFRLSPQCTLMKRLPWLYPVHPVAMAHFLEQGWWSMATVQAFISRRCSMANDNFGGNEFAGLGQHSHFRTTHVHSPQEMGQWALAFFALEPAPVLKATLMGHMLQCVGIGVWSATIVPMCMPHINDVDLDILLAVFCAPRSQSIVLAASVELDEALRNTIPAEEYDDYMPNKVYLPYRINPAFPSIGLEYMLSVKDIRSREALYEVGAYLKAMENTPIEYLAVPE